MPNLQSTAPLNEAAAITPSDDSANNFTPTRGIISNAGGVTSIVFADGNAAQITLTAGVLYPFSIIRVNATGTTATEIFALR